MDNPSFFRFRGSYNFCLKDDVEYGKINVKYSEVTKMIFDLKNEKPEILPNFKGGEKYLIAKMHFDGVIVGVDWDNTPHYGQSVRMVRESDQIEN